jgi:PAS domain S-box-containing protein
MSPTEVRAFTAFIRNGALKHAEVDDRLLNRMLDALPVAIYLTDAEGRLIYFNPAAAQLAGRKPALNTDRWCVTWKMFLPDGTQVPHDRCPMAAALRGEDAPVGIEAIAERPDGTRRWVVPCPAAIKDDAGKIIGGINVLIDVTDRKNAEIVAREKFQTIIETTPECVKLVAADGTLLFMNAHGLKMISAPAPEAVIGTSLYAVVAPEDRERYQAFNERVCRGEQGSLTFDIVGLQGGRRRMETHAAPLQHTDGTTVHLALTRDITDRKRAELSAQLLAAIVDSSDDAIISKDLDGIITSWNKSAERVFGYTAEETVGQSVTMLIPPDRLREEPEILARLRCGERVDHFETVRRRKDGTLLDISLTISPVRDADGVIVGASKIARDISERKQVEDDLRRANEELEQFAFSAGHDLKAPLRTVNVYSQLLGQRVGAGLDDEAQQFLRFIQSGTIRMEALLENLLTYARLRQIEKPPDSQVSLNDSLQAALADLAGAISESQAQISSGTLPSLRVHRTHMRQLFQNLIGNAIKYRRPNERPVVEIGADLQDGIWTIKVQDNGIGIAPESRDKVFGLFTRLHAGEQAGTGLGLAICQRIVERYHGRIWVESNKRGEGSTFRFTLRD